MLNIKIKYNIKVIVKGSIYEIANNLTLAGEEPGYTGWHKNGLLTFHLIFPPIYVYFSKRGHPIIHIGKVYDLK